MEIRSGFAAVNNTNLYYEDAGHGFPIIFIHNRSRDMHMWDDQFLFFARQYRAIRYDLRGFGMSDRSTGFYSHAFDLIDLIRFLKLDCVFLAGCGMGSGIAFEIALEKPEKIAGLITVNPVFPGFSYENSDGSIELLPEGERISSSIQPFCCPVIAITGEEEPDNPYPGINLLQPGIPTLFTARLSGAGNKPNTDRPVQFNRIVLTFTEWIESRPRATRQKYPLPHPLPRQIPEALQSRYGKTPL